MKTSAKRFYNAPISLVLLLSFQLLISGQSRAQYSIPGQDPVFPLYSELDTTTIKKYTAALDFETFNLKLVHELRNLLQADLAKQDPLVYWVYAKSMDLYPYGYGNAQDGAIALEYYTKAADKGLAQAEYFLYKLYWYGLMEVPADEKKALNYLQRAIQHGNKEGKAQGYLAMATLFGENEPGGLYQPNKDSVLFYLEKALTYTPNDTWALDYAGGLYEEKGNYEKAIAYLLRSDNENSQIKVATWLMEGAHVKKDVNRSLQMLYKIADQLMKVYGKNLDGYMGGSNPLHVLNNWYRCKKWITREQAGKYYNANWICD